MPLLKEALRVFENSNLKITERRLLMLEILYKENRYLSAKEVKELIKETYPGISPDTIYRNLHSFSELNILEETEITGEKYFRANCNTDEHHHHFICSECGFSIELEACPVSFFKEQIGEAKILSHRFELFGLCEQCTGMLN